MVDPLGESRKLVEKVRFSGDRLRSKGVLNKYSNQGIDAFFTGRDLPLTRELTPELADTLHLTCERLMIPPTAVKAFVFASPEIQAECYSDNSSKCIIRLSSSLIDLLEINELCFVIGHELGHFLYQHGVIKLNFGDKSYEFLMQQRSQEVSVDRIGYLASDSLDTSIKALMKTVSGLKSNYLRFDVSNYLSNMNKLSKTAFDDSPFSTHPTILFRCRALLWFSMKIRNIDEIKLLKQDGIVNLDKRITNDLARYVDGPIRKLIEEAKENVAMWTFIQWAIKDNTLDKDEQKVFAEEFGEDKLEKLVNLLRNGSISEVRTFVEKKLERAKDKLKHIMPISYEQVISQISKKYS